MENKDEIAKLKERFMNNEISLEIYNAEKERMEKERIKEDEIKLKREENKLEAEKRDIKTEKAIKQERIEKRLVENKRSKILYGLIALTLIVTLINTYNIININNQLNLGKGTDNAGKEEEANQLGQQGQQPSVEVSADDDAFIGSSGAPITIIEFSDFQCPFCTRAESAIKQVLENYKGKIKLVYRDFPLSFHQNAPKAAEAAECADEQGKFWEYHDILFEKQQEWSGIGIEKFKEYAKNLNLDTQKFNKCLDSGKMASEVQKDFEDGQKAGVSGTPTFFINGIPLVGAQPFSEFQKIIDAELSK